MSVRAISAHSSLLRASITAWPGASDQGPLVRGHRVLPARSAVSTVTEGRRSPAGVPTSSGGAWLSDGGWSCNGDRCGNRPGVAGEEGGPMATRPVLVGVDGSEESLRAVEWAAMQAKRHGSPLRIVSAPAMPPRMRAEVDPVTVANALRGMAAQSLAAALTRSEEVAPGLPVDTGLLSGPPAVALSAAGGGASMLVVGARGIGGFAAMILGSVSRYAAMHAACPVIVVRQETSAVHREIAVGIRDTENGTAALAF